ncbi:AAA domain-containing protein [Dichomitus squalens]|uniref:AAA domain-containing protein n=1 Tax=Dichomitus squalens TaxID=114155 RepID=A0A4Q9P644_9APHY|nr:AAA domain-containing protein [Dichomitus squalens]TBU59706.1 AAA domain-containing protein [Dichomitus squalens]
MSIHRGQTLAVTSRNAVAHADGLSNGLRPLRGNGKGGFKVHIVGNSGSGKSTLALELAALLDLPCIHLDQLFWKPGWRESTDEEFRERVRNAIDQSPRGWVVDGDYQRRAGKMVSEEATDVIWLDPPLILYFPRLLLRTTMRLFRLVPPCSPGCEEMASEAFFSRNSILCWCLSQHSVVHKREAERYRTDGVHVGGKRRRIGGWGGELAAWKRDVEEMIRAAGSDVTSD